MPGPVGVDSQVHCPPTAGQRRRPRRLAQTLPAAPGRPPCGGTAIVPASEAVRNAYLGRDHDGDGVVVGRDEQAAHDGDVYLTTS